MGAKLSVHCLGGLRIELDGRIISAFETDKAKALLVYLTSSPRHGYQRSHLAGLLWPDESEEKALHNLRQTLSSLRKTLGESAGDPGFIYSDRELIRLNPQADLWVDYPIFQKEFEEAFNHYQIGNGSGLFHIRRLKKAMSLYQGEFLAHFLINKSILFEEWMLLRREEFNLMAIRGSQRLADYHQKRGEVHQAIEYMSRIAALCPWDETVQEQLIYLLGLEGQFTAAKQQYLAFTRTMEESLSLLPNPEIKTLYQKICLAAQGKIPFQPKDKTLPPAWRMDQSPFIGREAEMDTLIEWLINPHNRLITLTGPGGIGKTRFALEIGDLLNGVFLDGVFFVNLVSANMADQIVSSIAKSIGFKFNDQSSNEKQLLDHLHQKQSLLILDNFEQLMQEKNSILIIDHIIQSTLSLKLFITSREMLNLVQEQVYLLSGLGFPQKTTVPISEVIHYEAINLFMDKVTRKYPQFTLHEKNLAHIIRICKILEGLPLGVELAAAAICENGCEEILEDYENNLGALATRMFNFHTRHRSLNAAFEISWELISPLLQKQLYSLSVFLDGFTLQAAQTICGTASKDLTTLVSKSLLRVDSFGRYSFHEVIRQIVQTKEIPDFNIEEIREKHAEFYALFLQTQQTALLYDGQEIALDTIQLELGNIRLSWQWALTHCRTDLLLSGLDTLYQYYTIRSLFKEGIQLFKDTLAQIQETCSDDALNGRLLWRLGALAYTARDDDQVLPNLLKSEQLLLQESPTEELATCRVYLAWAYLRDKNFSQSQTYSDSALAYFIDQQDDLGLTQAYLIAGSIKNRQGDYQQSHPLFEQAYQHCKKTKNLRNLVVTINKLADISCYEGNYDEAIKLYEESLSYCERLNDRYNQAVMLNNLGTIFHIRNEFDQAKKYYRDSLEITRDIGDLDGTALALNNLGELATWQKDYQSALEFSEEALQIARKLNENWTIIVCLNSLGEINCALNILPQSEAYLKEALSMAVEVNGLDLAARVMINLGRVYQRMGREEDAIPLLQAGLCHTATEQDSREKAQRWLAEMQQPTDWEINDRLLEKIIEEGWNHLPQNNSQ